MKTVVGMFDKFEDANHAVRDLHDAGFSKEDISLVASDEQGEYSRYVGGDVNGEKQDLSDGTAAGAGLGAILGGLGGLLVGLGALMIPGIGPVIAAGPIITALAGAGVGAVAGGIIGALVDLGIPEEHANYYAEGVHRGGTLVVLRADDMKADQAADIMNRYHPVDVERRASDWKAQGDWKGFNSQDTAVSQDFDRMHNTSAIPVTGTDLDDTNLSGRGVMDTTGNAELDDDIGLGAGDSTSTTGQGMDRGFGTTGTTDRDYNTGVGNQGYNRGSADDVSSTFGREGYNRNEIMGQGSGMEHDRAGMRDDLDDDLDDDKDIPVTGRDITERGGDVAVSDTTYKGADLRNEAFRDRSLGDNTTQRDWNYYDTAFRTDYQTRYGSMGQSYAYYQPAYRFGYDMAGDPHYQGWDWAQIEPVAREEWHRRGLVGAWDDFKDAIQHAWTSAIR